jgi:hypothetical protein
MTKKLMSLLTFPRPMEDQSLEKALKISHKGKPSLPLAMEKSIIS